jgi:hypothetical protein
MTADGESKGLPAAKAPANLELRLAASIAATSIF